MARYPALPPNRANNFHRRPELGQRIDLQDVHRFEAADSDGDVLLKEGRDHRARFDGQLGLRGLQSCCGVIDALLPVQSGCAANATWAIKSRGSCSAPYCAASSSMKTPDLASVSSIGPLRSAACQAARSAASEA